MGWESPLILTSTLEITVYQNDLINLIVIILIWEKIKPVNETEEPLTFAVKPLSLDILEIELLINDVLIDLGDVGNDKVKKNNFQNELIEEPDNVKDVDDCLRRKGWFTIFQPRCNGRILDVSHNSILESYDYIS